MGINRIVNGLELFQICVIQPALRAQLFLGAEEDFNIRIFFGYF